MRTVVWLDHHPDLWLSLSRPWTPSYCERDPSYSHWHKAASTRGYLYFQSFGHAVPPSAAPVKHDQAF